MNESLLAERLQAAINARTPTLEQVRMRAGVIRSRRRVRRIAVAAIAACLVAIAGVATLPVLGDHPVASADATAFLTRMANQSRTVQSGATWFTREVQIYGDETTVRDMWVSPTSVRSIGTEQGTGLWYDLTSETPVFPVGNANLSWAEVSNLPTTAGDMDKFLVDHATGDGTPEMRLFTLAGDCLRTLPLPPEATSAMFEVLATIPGVIVDQAFTDVLGRQTAAVHLGDQGFLIDSDSSMYLGEYALDENGSTGFARATVFSGWLNSMDQTPSDLTPLTPTAARSTNLWQVSVN